MPRSLLALLALAAGCAGSTPHPAPSEAGFPFAGPRCAQEAIRLERGDVPSDVVVVAFHVSPEGVPGDIRFIGTPAASEKARAAITRAITSCRWEPGRNAAGEPVAAEVTVPLLLRPIAVRAPARVALLARPRDRR